MSARMICDRCGREHDGKRGPWLCDDCDRLWYVRKFFGASAPSVLTPEEQGDAADNAYLRDTDLAWRSAAEGRPDPSTKDRAA